MDEGRDEKGRFKISHLFSLGNKGGRPPVYETEEEIHAKIYEYLEWEEKTSKGKYTIEGCALYLGFASRQSMQDYKENPKFSYVMGRFYLFMAHYHAQGLKWAGSYQGSAFWLKNFGGYVEESIQHQNQTITTVTPRVVDTGVPLANDEKSVKE